MDHPDYGHVGFEHYALGFVEGPIVPLWSDSLSFTTARRMPAASLLIAALKRQIISVLAMSEYDTQNFPSLITWVLCQHCMFIQHRRGLISIVPLESNRRKKPQQKSRLGWLPMANGKELMLSNLFLFFPTVQAKLVTFCFFYKIHIKVQSSFGTMDQFAFCWHMQQYLYIHQTTGSQLDALCVFFITGVRT